MLLENSILDYYLKSYLVTDRLMGFDMTSALLLPNYTIREHLKHFLPDVLSILHIRKIVIKYFLVFLNYNNQITRERNFFSLSNSIIS